MIKLAFASLSYLEKPPRRKNANNRMKALAEKKSKSSRRPQLESGGQIIGRNLARVNYLDRRFRHIVGKRVRG